MNQIKKVLILSVLVLSMGCSTLTPVQLQKEDFMSSGNARTFDNPVQNEKLVRKTELNLESQRLPDGSEQFNFLLSIAMIPIFHSYLDVQKSSELTLQIDSQKRSFSTLYGSKQDTTNSALGMGKVETIRFENIPLDFLEEFSKAKTASYQLQGKNGSSSGRLTEENISKLSKFYKFHIVTPKESESKSKKKSK